MKWLEDELYEQWKQASAEERPAIQEKLAECVRDHLKKAVIKKYNMRDEDVIQNATMAAIEHIEDFEGRDAVFSTWSHQIAFNKAVDEIDRQRLERERFVSIEALRGDREGEHAAWDPPDPDRPLDLVTSIYYQRKLERLTARERRVWDLHQRGHSEKEIADIMGSSIDAADSRLRAARKKLQET